MAGVDDPRYLVRGRPPVAFVVNVTLALVALVTVAAPIVGACGLEKAIQVPDTFDGSDVPFAFVAVSVYV